MHFGKDQQRDDRETRYSKESKIRSNPIKNRSFLFDCHLSKGKGNSPRESLATKRRRKSDISASSPFTVGCCAPITCPSEFQMIKSPMHHLYTFDRGGQVREKESAEYFIRRDWNIAYVYAVNNKIRWIKTFSHNRDARNRSDLLHVPRDKVIFKLGAILIVPKFFVRWINFIIVR